jgi:hypothetical protein
MRGTPKARTVPLVRICLIGIGMIIATAAAGCSSPSPPAAAGAAAATASTNPSAGAASPTGSYNPLNAKSGGGGGLSAATSTPGSGTPLQFSGTGSGVSEQFLVNVDTVSAQYTYDCSAAGGSGDFSADLVSGDPSSQNYDDENIVSTSGPGSSATVTVSPQNLGGYYDLQITTTCSWSVSLQAG